MKITNIKIVGLFCLALLSFHISQAQITSDYDKETDFSKYQTYAFAGWEKNSDQILNEFDKKRILDAMQNEFSERGLELVESDADANVTLYVVVDNKTSTTAYTTYNGGLGYGPGWGWGMGMGGLGGTSTTNYSEDDYKEGTLVVDMYDQDSKKLVWQGVLQTVVKENPEKREKTIPKKISKLMKEFPVAPVN